jgi:AraC-like DNA-binding protein
MARSRAPNSTLGDSRSASSPLPGGPVGLARASAWLHEERFLQVPDVTELATTAGVHPTELACMFRAHYGESIGEYARRLRLEWAAERLAWDRHWARVSRSRGRLRRPEPLHARLQTLGRTSPRAIPNGAPLSPPLPHALPRSRHPGPRPSRPRPSDRQMRRLWRTGRLLSRRERPANDPTSSRAPYG